MSKQDKYKKLELAVSKVIAAMDADSVVSGYRRYLIKYISNIKSGTNIKSSLYKLDELMMSPRLLPDVRVDSLSREEWMSLLLDVLDEIDVLLDNREC